MRAERRERRGRRVGIRASRQQVTALTRWWARVAKLTQAGQVTMAGARHLVGLLDTGDEMDQIIGARVFGMRSSAELPHRAAVLAWAKAVGLVGVVRGPAGSSVQ